MHSGCNFRGVVYISLLFFWFPLWMPYKQDLALIQKKNPPIDRKRPLDENGDIPFGGNINNTVIFYFSSSRFTLP
jgi:hypothetical protein